MFIRFQPVCVRTIVAMNSDLVYKQMGDTNQFLIDLFTSPSDKESVCTAVHYRILVVIWLD